MRISDWSSDVCSSVLSGNNDPLGSAFQYRVSKVAVTVILPFAGTFTVQRAASLLILWLFWLSSMMRVSFRAKSSPACVKSPLIGCVFALLISYRMLVRHLDEERRSRLWTVVLTFTSQPSPVAHASSLISEARSVGQE